MYRATKVAALAACLLAFSREAVSANDQSPEDRLPEPALRFAKDASLRVIEMEREWVKLSEGLARSFPDFNVTESGQSEGRLREEAGRVLVSARKLLEDQKRIVEDVQRFKEALKKTASSYREVAALYKAHATKARAEEVREDYFELGRVYEAKARFLTDRAQTLATPSGTKPAADIIEEGNLSLERLVEAFSVGPMSDMDRELFTRRLKKHEERCKRLAGQLSTSIEALLEKSETAEMKQRRVGGGKKAVDTSPGAEKGALATTAQETRAASKEMATLLGASWSSPVTIQGVRCLQIIRLAPDGTCSQSVYLSGASGRGKLLGSGQATFQLDPAGYLSFFQSGVLVERGKITLFGNDQWVYEILENRLSPQLAGTRLDFTREGLR